MFILSPKIIFNQDIYNLQMRYRELSSSVLVYMILFHMNSKNIHVVRMFIQDNFVDKYKDLDKIDKESLV